MSATEFWSARGAVITGEGASRRVAHFGDPAAEAETALRAEGSRLVPLLGTAALRLGGPDRAAFLHGQLSNEVQGLGAGACNHTLQLNARGQAVGEGQLCVRPDALFLTVDDGRGPEVLASLRAHIVFDDVRLEDLADGYAALTVQGAGAAEAVGRAFGEVPAEGRFAEAPLAGAAAGADREPVRAVLLRRRRSPWGGVDVHLPASGLPAAVAALQDAGATPLGERALDLMRVVGGVPSAAHDGAGGSLPQELGLASALSYRKGCYLGQEIMARIEARGAVRKGLTRMRLMPEDGVAAAPEGLAGRAVRLGERTVGRLGTVAALPGGGLAALAVLRLDLPGTSRLSVVDDAGRATAAEPWPLPEAAGGTGGSASPAAGGSGGAQPGRPR